MLHLSMSGIEAGYPDFNANPMLEGGIYLIVVADEFTMYFSSPLE